MDGTWYVSSTHLETLHDGRMIAPGTDVEGVDPERDKGLIDRGALTWREVGAFSATDDAAQLANENELDLADVTGTGKGNRITVKDVKKALESRDSSGESNPDAAAGGAAEPA